eukprot:1134942-Pelagomonas_calceolata.AAC.1
MYHTGYRDDDGCFSNKIKCASKQGRKEGRLTASTKATSWLGASVVVKKIHCMTTRLNMHAVAVNCAASSTR